MKGLGIGSNCVMFLRMVEMDFEVVKRFYGEGVILIVFDVFEGIEFGIDYFLCNIGFCFKGVKMILFGLYFIYYSVVFKGGEIVFRIGMFLFLKC